MSDRPGMLDPLRERSFRFYFLSRSVNLVGTTMAGISLVFAVLEVSDSPTALGTVLAAHSIPMAVFLLAGGVIADRFGRTRVIQACNVLAGLTQLAIAALVISGAAEIWHLVVLTALNGTVASISMPALAGIVPALVPRDQLQPANVLLSLMRSSMTILGPSVAGVLVVAVGPGWALAVDGATYLLAAALLLGARIPPRERIGEQESMLPELREGWQVFTGTRWLWVVVLGFMVLNALEQGAFNTLGPVLAKGSAIGEHGWGLILSAEAAGFLVMGLVLSRVRLQRPLLWGMLGMGLYGLPMVALGTTTETAVVIAAAFVGGMGVEVFSLGWNLAMQENIADDMLSRAYSYDALGSFVAIPVGQLAFGPLAVVFGLQQTILVAGLVYLVVVALVLTSRAVRTLPRAAAPGTVGAAPVG
ncbi:MFS transporter [Nocardioides marmotae]|nr:MFS transporter [Nocardioides marmotae]